MAEQDLHTVAIEIQLYAALLLKFFNQALEERLRERGERISSLQHGILRMLQAETLTASEISQRMGLDPSTLVRAVDALERKGLAQRGSDPRDRRRNPITITDKGRELVNAVPVIAGEDLPFRALQSFGPESTSRLRDLLHGLMQEFPEGKMVAEMMSGQTDRPQEDAKGVSKMKAQPDLVVEVRNLVKQYPGTKAVDGISFDVHQGEIFGMVGPNGAGKTTTIECLEGLRRADGGTIQVLGLDPLRDRYRLRERIGVQFQSAALPDRIKVWEAVDLFASFYPRPADWRMLLEQMGLAEKKDAYFAKLSGGQKQRVFIALALVSNPDLAFLDELTTGLDPQARRAMWDEVRGIRERGTTVFLTTHFMEEAERLCDRVAIIDHGKIVALDTPQNLIDSLGAENRVVFEAQAEVDEGALRAVPGVVRIERIGERVVVYGQEDGLVSGVVNALEAGGIRFENLRTEQPTLEDVFLALTGKEMRD